MENLKYPIGRFDSEINRSAEEVKASIETLHLFPEILTNLAANLSDSQLEKCYRPESWNIRQVVHHVADSHMNMYIRLKCALSEENPTIKGYDQDLWADMVDSKMPISVSLSIISGLHARIVSILNNLNAQDLQKTYYHDGYKKSYILANVVCLYGWHSMHHLEHIKIALKN